VGVDKKMAVNGSNFIDQPWNTTFSPYTDIFENVVGNGQVFWLFPLIILTFGIFVKTRNPAVTSLFMIASGGILGSGSIFLGAGQMGVVFGIFAGIGVVSLIIGMIFQRGD